MIRDFITGLALTVAAAVLAVVVLVFGARP